ncbi:3930_t:CDS:2, partial [Acaulospora morrowiae]
MTRTSSPPSRGMVVFSVSFYIITATTMIFVNKVQRQVCVGLFPLIIVNVLGLSFNTACLQYVDASFYQVRFFFSIAIVFFSYIFLKQRSSAMVLLACSVVCTGFFIGVSSEHLTISMVGITFGVLSSISTALHAIIIKKSLDIVQGNTMELVYYNNLLSVIAFTPLIFLFGEQTEITKLISESDQNNSLLRTFVIGIFVTGFFGFLINIAGFFQIKVTSPVTHMISSAFRGVLQTMLGAFIFEDVLTSGRVGSIILILAGSCYYTWIKDQENRNALTDTKIYSKLENGQIEDDDKM